MIHAAVTRTSWTLLESNHSLRAEIDVPNTDGLLRPGMYATVTIQLDRRPEGLVIPVGAVVREGTNVFCYVVRDGRIERLPIEVGARSGGDIEIRAGLPDDVPVVVKQPERFRDGQAVRVAPTAP
ncbi:MAG: efflux RND transporter periplasmic adaptor subunit [Planctomycetaceae bacterium]